MRKKNLFEKYANTHNGRVKLEELAKIFHTEVMSTNLLWVGSNLFVMVVNIIYYIKCLRKGILRLLKF